MWSKKGEEAGREGSGMHVRGQHHEREMPGEREYEGRSFRRNLRATNASRRIGHDIYLKFKYFRRFPRGIVCTRSADATPRFGGIQEMPHRDSKLSK